jgi:acetyltransferase-like isoleucine patch superfamily enzyme
MKKKFKCIYMQLLGRFFGSVGHLSWVSPFGTYLCRKSIYIGDNVYIGKGAYLSASEGILIGNGVTIGPELLVMGGDHNFAVIGARMCEINTGGTNNRIVIEDDVWLGARVTLLKRVKIGEGAIIGAGAVVTKEVPPYTIYAGNPAKFISPRFTKEKLAVHLRGVGSKYSIEELLSIYE